MAFDFSQLVNLINQLLPLVIVLSIIPLIIKLVEKLSA